ncbi:MAG: hypothetical protein ABSF66_06340 [Terriglobales bacterium]|jgi:ribosomal protein L40E
MPSSRPNLTLDEQSFQDLLSAAFTIQEHNDHLQQAHPTQAEPEAYLEPEATSVCRHCGAPKPTDASRCQSCGLDEFRPGERMQRKWASMWLMSQEQVLWPERTPETREAAQKKDVPPLADGRTPLSHSAVDSASSGLLALPVARAAAKETISQEKTETIHARVRGESALDDPALDTPARDKAAAENEWTAAATEDLTPEDSDLAVQTFQLSASDDSSSTEESLDPIIDAMTDPMTEAATDAMADARDTGPSYLIQRFADLRETLSFHRADLYLGVAVFVAAVALLWPTAGSPQPAALGPWERSLVALGIAEAPPPVVHLQGDPGVEVWVDPHSALYYCPGEEQYGKTADGRITSQREAQMDRFEPAGRSACE